MIRDRDISQSKESDAKVFIIPQARKQYLVQLFNIPVSLYGELISIHVISQPMHQFFLFPFHSLITHILSYYFCFCYDALCLQELCYEKLKSFPLPAVHFYMRHFTIIFFQCIICLMPYIYCALYSY